MNIVFSKGKVNFVGLFLIQYGPAGKNQAVLSLIGDTWNFTLLYHAEEEIGHCFQLRPYLI